MPIRLREEIIKDALDFCTLRNIYSDDLGMLYHHDIIDDRLYVMCGLKVIYYVDLPPIPSNRNGNKNK